MAEHSELVSEMSSIEKLGNQERLKMAKKRRLQQLKKWNQREKEYMNQKKNKKTDLNSLDLENGNEQSRRRNDHVHFVPSVMLLEAAARNDIDEVRRLLMMGVDADSTNEDGLTALHQCCIDDSEEMMKLLVDFGANVNAKDSEQWTPLHAAATCGHLHLVRYLIEKGANLLAVNADNNMPYDICEQEETLDYIEQQMASRGITQQQIDETRNQTERQMLEFLKGKLESGVDLNSIKFGDCDASALHVAAANGYLQVVEFLLSNNFNINIDDDDHWQPIHAAVCWGQPDVLEILAQAGADLDARTKNGETLFDICEDPELKEQIEQLKNEMETKQLLQQQSLNGSKLKRSHSQNTRTQSVRRTSIREKRDTSRREAREEAKIRHHLDDDLPDAAQFKSSSQENHSSMQNKSQQTTSKPTLITTNLTNVTNINNVTNVNNINQHQSSSFSYHLNHHQNQQHQQHQQHQQESSLNIPSFSLNNYAQDHSTNQSSSVHEFQDHSQPEMRSQQFIRSSNGSDTTNANDSSSKLEIRINHQTQNVQSNSYSTQMPNANTLSDLKRFRADLRHRNHTNSDHQDNGDDLYSSNNNNHKNALSTMQMNSKSSNVNKFKEHQSQTDGVVTRFDTQNSKPQKFENVNHGSSGGRRSEQNNVNQRNTYSNASPNSTLKKFRGDPSEMIGEMQKRKCCSMM